MKDMFDGLQRNVWGTYFINQGIINLIVTVIYLTESRSIDTVLRLPERSREREKDYCQHSVVRWERQ